MSIDDLRMPLAVAQRQLEQRTRGELTRAAYRLLTGREACAECDGHGCPDCSDCFKNVCQFPVLDSAPIAAVPAAGSAIQ